MVLIVFCLFGCFCWAKCSSKSERAPPVLGVRSSLGFHTNICMKGVSTPLFIDNSEAKLQVRLMFPRFIASSWKCLGDAKQAPQFT